MVYDKYSGSAVSVYIEIIDDKDPYTVIGPKAFLSCKSLYEIKLPDTICEIGDWAFAHMKELKRIVVPAKDINIGRDVFLDCDNLSEVIVCPDKSDNKGLSYLLASCITILKACELLDFKMASENNELWCELYDRKLTSYICQTDDKGFQPVIVGWFNDEGEEEQLERYIEKVRSDKIKLSFLRLKYDSYINRNSKTILLSYLKKHVKSSASSDESSWKTFREVLATDIEYAKLAVLNNFFSEELILELIEYLNSNNGSTEIVAYLISSIEGENKNIDEQFEL